MPKSFTRPRIARIAAGEGQMRASRQRDPRTSRPLTDVSGSQMTGEEEEVVSRRRRSRASTYTTTARRSVTYTLSHPVRVLALALRSCARCHEFTEPASGRLAGPSEGSAVLGGPRMSLRVAFELKGSLDTLLCLT